MTTQYVALLRGINVGGSNVIRMAELRACLEQAGFDDVATYIQSGNILFSAPAGHGPRLADRIAEPLSERFGYRGTIVVRSHEQLRAVLAEAPEWLGADPSAYRYDCIFLKEPLTAEQAVEQLNPREGVDRVAPGPGVLYSSRLASRASQSRLSKIAALPLYPSITIRNWKTTTTLARLMDER